MFNFLLSSPGSVLTAALSLFLLAACQSEATSTEEEASISVEFRCELIGEQEGVPQYALYTILDESKVKLVELNACDRIEPADYRRLGIAQEAIAAAGGWYAGFGDYLYAVEEEDGELSFYFGGIGEGQTEPIYSAIARYAEGRFQILRPLHQADLAGYYTHETTDSAFVLFVGMQGDTLTGRLFGREGQLPPAHQLLQSLGEFGAGSPFVMDYSLSDLRFSSPLGEGSVLWRPDEVILLFQTFEGESRKAAFNRMQ